MPQIFKPNFATRSLTLAIILFTLFLLTNLLNLRRILDYELISKDDSQLSSHELEVFARIIDERKLFFKKHLKITDFLSSFEENSNIELLISNMTNSDQEINADLFFLTEDKIDREIGIMSHDSDRNKVVKIFNFVDKNFVHTYPVFDYFNKYLSDDAYYKYFFPTYGSGLCSNVAIVFSQLVEKYGFDARVWFFEGHVATEVFYDDGWHFFDPDTLGYFEDSFGDIISLDGVKNLAKKNSLEKYNSIIASENGSYFENMSRKMRISGGGLREISFFPYEKYFFLDNLFMLSSNGNYLTDRGYPLTYRSRPFLDEHKRSMANFIRVIPIKNFMNKDKISINSFFPIVGIFISLPNNESGVKEFLVFPEIKFQSEQVDLLDKNIWIEGEVLSDPKFNKTYLNFSFALKHLENSPSHEFELRNIKQFSENHPNAMMLVVSAYSFRNADFSPESISGIDREVFEVNYSSAIQ